MMDQKQIIADLECRAQRLGLSFTELCQRANIAQMTFRRWRNGQSSPTLRNLSALDEALTAAEDHLRASLNEDFEKRKAS